MLAREAPLSGDRRAAAATLADRIDAALPQTQCGRCGHAGCRPYAEAVAAGAPLNRCPPGGARTIATLATITGRAVLPLDPACGAATALLLARIDEAACIGCTRCIAACPVDAIIGAPKRMHGVLAGWCTGCALCVPACPVDCIGMVAAGRAWSPEDARAARARLESRKRRLAAAAEATAAGERRRERQAAVAAALARARARRRASAPARER